MTDKRFFLYGGDRELWYNVEVTEYANIGPNVINNYVTWDKENSVAVEAEYRHYGYTDALDLDNDGDRTEKFIHIGNTNINLLLTRELTLTSTVGEEKEKAFFHDNILDSMDKKMYQVSIENQTTIDTTYVKMITTLPYI